MRRYNGGLVHFKKDNGTIHSSFPNNGTTQDSDAGCCVHRHAVDNRRRRLGDVGSCCGVTGSNIPGRRRRTVIQVFGSRFLGSHPPTEHLRRHHEPAV